LDNLSWLNKVREFGQRGPGLYWLDFTTKSSKNLAGSEVIFLIYSGVSYSFHYYIAVSITDWRLCPNTFGN